METIRLDTAVDCNDVDHNEVGTSETRMNTAYILRGVYATAVLSDPPSCFTHP